MPSVSTLCFNSIYFCRYLTQNKQAGSVEGMKQLDELLVQLAGSVNTDLLPGENDPATGILPQQPLHKCMFPKVKYSLVT